MTIKKADEIIERLEIMSDDYFYPLEENKDYKRMCFIVMSKKTKDDIIDNSEFMEYYKNIIHDMKKYC